MTRAALATANAIVLATVVVACGGKAAPPTRPPAPSGPSVWSALTPGATWTLESSYTSEGEQPQTLTATVTAVAEVGGRKTIDLEWETFDGTETYGFEGSVPTQIVLGDGGVWLIGGDEYGDDDADGPPTHAEPPVAELRKDGHYTRIADVGGETIACFGGEVVEDPEDEIGCGSDCNAHLCVGAKSGIVKVVGTWAPEGGEFQARGFDGADAYHGPP
jgi:hypothetical protein